MCVLKVLSKMGGMISLHLHCTFSFTACVPHLSVSLTRTHNVGFLHKCSLELGTQHKQNSSLRDKIQSTLHLSGEQKKNLCPGLVSHPPSLWGWAPSRRWQQGMGQSRAKDLLYGDSITRQELRQYMGKTTHHTRLILYIFFCYSCNIFPRR